MKTISLLIALLFLLTANSVYSQENSFPPEGVAKLGKNTKITIIRLDGSKYEAYGDRLNSWHEVIPSDEPNPFNTFAKAKSKPVKVIYTRLDGETFSSFDLRTWQKVDAKPQAPPATKYEFDPAKGLTQFDLYPNPTSGSTTISFVLLESKEIRFSLYTLDGFFLNTFLNESFEPGRHVYEFNSQQFQNGEYVFVFEYGTEKITGRISIQK